MEGVPKRIALNKNATTCPFCGTIDLLPVARVATECSRCSRIFEIPTRAKAGRHPARLWPIRGVDSLEIIRSARPGKKISGLSSIGGGRLKHHINGRHVECFGCARTITISPHVTAADCPHCHSRIELDDLDIHSQRSESVRTLGNVRIHSGAAFVGSTLACANLTVDGALSGGATCSGTLTLRHSGRVTGIINCAHLVIDLNTKLRFLNEVRTRTAEIHGDAEGEIYCTGSVIVSRHGSLAGSLVAADLQVDPGGTVLAETTIRRDNENPKI